MRLGAIVEGKSFAGDDERALASSAGGLPVTSSFPADADRGSVPAAGGLSATSGAASASASSPSTSIGASWVPLL